MLLLFNKKILILAGIISVITLSLIVVFNPASKETAINGQKTIICDPGHGGMDSGAVAEDGTLEKDINLKIALKFQELAKSKGYNVIMTRTKDVSLHTTEKADVRTQKREDLRKRRDMANKSGAAAFVGIHLNKFPQNQYDGAQVFYSQNQGSRELGLSIQEALISNLNDGNKRVAKPAEDIYILKNTKLPSVIVECGFLSNTEELSKLKDEKYQIKVAESVLKGLESYLNESEKVQN